MLNLVIFCDALHFSSIHFMTRKQCVCLCLMMYVFTQCRFSPTSNVWCFPQISFLFYFIMLLYDVVRMQQFLLLCFRVWPSSFKDYAHQLTSMLRCSQWYLLIWFSVPLCRFSTNMMWILCLNQIRTQRIKQWNLQFGVLFFLLHSCYCVLGATHTQSTNLRMKNCAFKLFITWSQ